MNFPARVMSQKSQFSVRTGPLVTESLLCHEDVFYWGEFGKSIIVPFLMLDRRFRIDFRVAQALITDNLTRNHHCDGGGALTRHGSEAWC